MFWGTVSLFGTLALLVVGFLFFSAAGAAFLRTRSTSRTSITAPKRYLPPLTADEQAEAQRVMSQFRVRRDDVESITWYTPPSGGGYHTGVYLYIGTKTNDDPWLRWRIRYYGDDWLFIRSFRIKVDAAEAETLEPRESLKRDNSGGSVWESFDEPADDHGPLLNKILAGQNVVIRFEGRDGIKDIALTDDNLREMRHVLLVYRSLGGKWRAD